MIESFIIVLREGAEVALILGILIVHLRKIQRQELIRSVLLGLALALASSIVIAFILRSSALDSEMLEGYLMLVAAIFVGTMIVWMWTTAKSIRHGIQTKVDKIARHTSVRMHIGILLLSYLLVLSPS